MKDLLGRNATLVSHLALAGVMVLLVVLLAWGLTTANLVAMLVAGGGLAFIIVLVGTNTAAPDNLRSQATERTLRLASRTLDLMSQGLTGESCRNVCQLLLPETQAAAICMTDTRNSLAYVGESVACITAGDPISAQTEEVIRSGHMETFANMGADEWKAAQAVGVRPAEELSRYGVGLIVPLLVADHVVGTVKFYYRSGRDVDRTQMAIVRGFSELLSTQLSTYELDRQAELTARAELKALQAQINPHFLFNTLNTIASFTRTDPTKARNLLREFSSFYRYTLQSSQNLIPLASELEQTRRYLKIEKARFGEDRIVETERVEPGCEEVKVPGFLIQPIVENSVRHAMRDEGPLHIDVQVVSDGDDVMIAVADDGLGMDEEVAQRLMATVEKGMRAQSGSGKATMNPDGSIRGAGVALSNVAERVEHFFGVGSGVEIMSRPGEGTVVTLRLVNVAPGRDGGRDEQAVMS